MPTAAFNIGRDVSLVINMPQGPVEFSNITGFTRKQISTSLESKRLEGDDEFAEIPSGWEGTIEIDRANGNVDRAMAYLENLYYAGQAVPYSTISEITTERDGSLTQFRYTRVVFKFDNAGDAKGDAKITQTLSWKGSRRRLQGS